MGNRLYVGNLPFHATEELIKQKFASCGEVKEVSLMLDRMTGQSRGFCFVEMATPEGAQKALDDRRGLALALAFGPALVAVLILGAVVGAGWLDSIAWPAFISRSRRAAPAGGAFPFPSKARLNRYRMLRAESPKIATHPPRT